jgi:hypothetical protein
VDVTLAVEGRHSADELRSLREWLLGEDVLRGRVRFVEPTPAPGTLGSVVETLAVALGPGGVATATASVLIAWIRRRTSDVKLRVIRQDGSSYELTATNVPDMDATALDELAKRLSADPADGTAG